MEEDEDKPISLNNPIIVSEVKSNNNQYTMSDLKTVFVSQDYTYIPESNSYKTACMWDTAPSISSIGSVVYYVNGRLTLDPSKTKNHIGYFLGYIEKGSITYSNIVDNLDPKFNYIKIKDTDQFSWKVDF